MITNFAIGLIVLSFTLKLINSLGKCTNKNIRNCLTGLMITSLILVVSSISFVVCNINCNCDSQKSFSKIIHITYFILLGITITVLGSVINVTARGNTDCQSLKGPSNILWVLGVIIIITSIVFGVVEYRTQVSSGITAGVNRLRGTNMSYRYGHY